MKKIHNPHDYYFRTAMSDIRVAKEFFEYHLPNNILKAADLNSLQLQKSSFIDEHLKASMADVLYSVKLNRRPGYFYIIVEHQRNPDKLMPYRLLRYILRIIDHHLKKKDYLPLPIVVPLVFYNGKKRYPFQRIFLLYLAKKSH